MSKSIPNKFFSAADQDVLLSFDRWHLVANGVMETAPVSPPENYRAWVAGNTHQHPYREMFFVLSGTTFYSLNGFTYQCHPGMLFLIDAGETHDFYYPPFAGDFRHIWFGQAGNTIIMRSVYGYTAGKVRTENTGELTGLDHSGLSFLEKWHELPMLAVVAPDFAVLQMKYAWGNLITELYRRGLVGDAGVGNEENECRKIITAVAGHIRDAAGKDLDLEKLAHLAGYSKFHFARRFKEYTGQTVHNFINDCRRERIRELRAEKFTWKEIAGELGFSGPQAFSRWYGSHRG